MDLLRLAAATAALALPLLAARPALASPPRLYDQSDVTVSASITMSQYVVASDVQISPFETRLDTITLWVSGETPPDFEGEAAPQPEGGPSQLNQGIGWAIFADDEGTPGGLIASGYDPTPTLTATGQFTPYGDIYQVRVDLDGRPRANGLLWVAVHEGPWGSGSDGTMVWLYGSETIVGAKSRIATATASPGPWSEASRDYAITVEGDVSLHYQGGTDPAASRSITVYVGANDFTVATATQISSVDIFLSDSTANDNGILDGFDGTLSWAIYPDDGSAPGASPLFTGQDSSPVLLDTREQDVFNTDIVRARIELEGRPTLDAGTYWLAVHEGSWLSPPDSDSVYWQKGVTTLGSSSVYSSPPTAPGNWTTAPEGDYAFVLFEDQIFSSGFDAGVACAWSNVPSGAPCF